MARSLSLAALRALRRGPEGAGADWPARPKGALVWLHLPDPARLPALRALTDLIEGEAALVVTLPETAGAIAPGRAVVLTLAPADSGPAARAFLAHWQPDVIVWLGGALHPILLAESDALGAPRILADARADLPLLTDGNWLPGLARAMVARFDHALAVDQEAAQRLRRAGMAPETVEVSGALVAPPQVLACNERERRDMAALIGARPVWLAAAVPAAEYPAVIAAMSRAMMRAHRLLLILVPADPADGLACVAAIRAAGLSAVCRSGGAEPGADTAVYVADQADEAGLWYRLAPLTYLGGSMTGGAVPDPFEPAALGSAILHGPQVGDHGAAFARLARAGATRMVRSGADLGAAVEALQAPDRAALMAHAAWDVASAGAEAAVRLATLIRDGLVKAGG